MSYSSSIKNLLTSKIREQKQEKQGKEKEKEEGKKYDHLFRDFNQSFVCEDKQTVVKRPAKPLHRDEPHYAVNYFVENEQEIPIFLQSKEIEAGEDKIFTMRDQFNKLEAPVSSARNELNPLTYQLSTSSYGDHHHQACFQPQKRLM